MSTPSTAQKSDPTPRNWSPHPRHRLEIKVKIREDDKRHPHTHTHILPPNTKGTLVTPGRMTSPGSAESTSTLPSRWGSSMVYPVSASRSESVTVATRSFPAPAERNVYRCGFVALGANTKRSGTHSQGTRQHHAFSDSHARTHITSHKHTHCITHTHTHTNTQTHTHTHAHTHIASHTRAHTTRHTR